MDLIKRIVVLVKSVQSVAMNVRLLALCRYGFYLSVLLILYGTLFPFQFDFSSFSWSRFSLLPFWDAERGRIHSLPDMLSNALLTVPLGFFGLLQYAGGRKLWGVAQWFFVGLCLGLLSEIIQLAIPSRLSDITDAFNNGIGALAGAVFACLFGAQIMDLLSGSLLDRKHTYFLILVGIVTAGMLLPFDFSLDVSHLGRSLKHLWMNPWELGIPIQDEWILMVEFVMIGGLVYSVPGSARNKNYASLGVSPAFAAGTAALPAAPGANPGEPLDMGGGRLIATVIALPFMLEMMQFLVESHAPSGRDLAMNLVGVVAGLAAARIKPALVRPATGFVLMNLAIIAQGLSPYHFGGRSHFEWIPLVEYYNQTTGAALYDAMSGILIYGLLVALWPRRTTILWAIALAGIVELAQTYIPGRSAGVTDILIAGIGSWVGFTVSKSATDYTDYKEMNP